MKDTVIISVIATIIGYGFGHYSKESHICHEAEYKKAFLDCMKDREKVREILKGDSLNCLLRSPHDGAVIYW